MERLKRRLRALYKKRTPLTFDELILLLVEKTITMKWSLREDASTLRYRSNPLIGDINKILIIQLSAIGDVVLSTPTIKGLRERYPDAYIAYLVEPAPSELIAENPYLDDLFVFPKDRCLDGVKEEALEDVLKEIKDFILSLKRKGFDWVLNLNPTPRAAYITSLISARNITGLTIDEAGRPYIRGNVWVLYKYINFMTEERFLEEGGKLSLAEINLRMAGVDPSTRKLTIFMEDGDEILEDYGIKEGDLLIGLNPGSNVEARRWLPERFASLGDLLIDAYGAKIILFGGPRERELVMGIRKMMKREVIVDLPERTDLKRLVTLLRRCAHLITNDTGPMHIAAAVGTPTIAICGPTRIGAYGAGHLQIQADIPCVGCGPATSCRTRRCMEAIRVEDILGLLRFQRGEISHPPLRDGINTYKALDPEGPLFSYINLQGQDDIMERILDLLSLNLWVMENQRFGYIDPPFGWAIIKERLVKEYGEERVNDGIKESIKEIERYKIFLDDSFMEVEEGIRSGREDMVDLIEEIHKKEIERRVGRIFDLFSYTYQGPRRDPVDLYIRLYQRKRSALSSLLAILEEARRDKMGESYGP